MSLLTLLLGILSALAPLSGIRLPEPEPAAASLPARELVLEPQCDRGLTGREEERMLAAIRFRCELLGLRGVQVQRQGQDFILRVGSGLITSMEAYTETLDELESILNERTSMQLLPVHRNSELIVQDGEVQELLAAYETAVVAYEESHSPEESAPLLPELPQRLHLQDYQLAEYQASSPEDGAARYEYMVVQRPEIMAQDNLLVTEQEVERAEVDTARGTINVELTARGGDILARLTRSMQPGQERLAILLDGVPVCAPVVHTELGCSFFISGLTREEGERVVDGLVMPLPVQIRITARRSAD